MNMLRRLLPFAIAPVIVAAIACSDGAPATPTAETQATPAAAAPTATNPSKSESTSQSVSNPQATVGAGPVAAVQQTPELEPADIVAAHEAVINGVYRAVLPSIVNINIAARAPIGDAGPFGSGAPGALQPRGQGSGFVWDDRGYIVTNNHVVAGAEVVSVKFHDGTEVIAEVVGTDPNSDLAVVKVELPKEKLAPVVLGDSAKLAVGQMAIAIGHPFGESFTLTTGIVSAVGRVIPSGSTPFGIPEAIQTDAAINPGNSGGPLLDRTGSVIGINVQIRTESGGNTGVGFAIPVNIAKIVVPALIADGTFDYAYLGVSLSNVTQEVAGLMKLPADTRGALLVSVARSSPADRAGLRAGTVRQKSSLGVDLNLGGDIVIAVDGTPIQSSDDLVSYTALRARPGDTRKFTVMRDGKEVTVDLTFGTRPR